MNRFADSERTPAVPLKRASGKLLATLFVCGFLAVMPARSGRQEVSPGTVVRWPGQSLESCAMEARSWLPLQGACWYPIDLLTAPGSLTLVRQHDGMREETVVEVGAYPYEVQYITLEDDSQVQLSAEDLQRVQEENRRIGSLWSRATPRRFELPLASPLAPLPSGGRFGARRFFNNQPRSPHTGRDYSAAAGTPVLSVAAGTVALTGDFFFPGKSVFVDHGDGLISMYFHLSGVGVETGDDVARGEVLGLVGQSGRATGPHLHLGLRWHGARVDPAQLMQAVETVPALP